MNEELSRLPISGLESCRGWLAIAAGLLCACMAAQGSPQYVLQDLGTFGWPSAEAWGLNDSGTIVGFYRATSGGPSRAYWWDGAFHDLGPGAAGGVNNSGAIAGSSAGRAVIWHDGVPADVGPGGAIDINDNGDIAINDGNRAFVIQNGVRRVLDPPRTTLGGVSFAYRINESAAVVGGGDTDPYPTSHALVWTDGQHQDLGTLGGRLSEGQDINDFGIVVGGATDPLGATHAFYWDRSLHDLGLGGAGGVNNRGQVVGVLNNPRRAFLYSYLTGSMEFLPDLGYGAAATRINDLGVIVGTVDIVTDTGRQTHIALWQLVPEAGGLATLGVGLAGFLAVALRRRSDAGARSNRCGNPGS